LPRLLLATYVVAVHIALAVILLKPNIIDRVRSQLSAGSHTTVFHHEMVKYHKRMASTVPSNSVVLIGDSHTQGIAAAAIVDKAINFGIAGDTTINVLSRLPIYQTSLNHAQSIVLQVGINDLILHRKPEDVINDFVSILTALPNKPIFVVGLLPVDEKVERFSGLNTEVTVLNQKIKDLANERPNVSFIETAASVRDDKGHLRFVRFCKRIALYRRNASEEKARQPTGYVCRHILGGVRPGLTLKPAAFAAVFSSSCYVDCRPVCGTDNSVLTCKASSFIFSTSKWVAIAIELPSCRSTVTAQ